MRVDFNVPRDENGDIIDDTKMKAAFPSIEYVLSNDASLILMSHLGRPKGKVDARYSLKRIADHLGNLVNAPVKMADDCIGPGVERAAQELKPGEILVLENVRFHPEEEKNDKGFSRKLAGLGDLFVNDAFGSSHRAHSSTAGVAEFLPVYAGFLMEKEVKMLKQVLEYPQSPRVAILGGAKVSDKIKLIDNLLEKMDFLLLGGGIANTFLKAQDNNIGKSIFEEDFLAEARRLMEKADKKNVQILLPVDVIVTEEIASGARGMLVKSDKVPDNMMIVDIGPDTVENFKQVISNAQTIVWNGPLGVTEYKQFSAGTEQTAIAVARSSATSVIGGGESVAAIHKIGIEKQITHISTGGGATLEFLEGRDLPGVTVCGAVLQRS
jgi:phosphoglycerate kinase